MKVRCGWIWRLARGAVRHNSRQLRSAYIALVFGVSCLVAVLGVRSDLFQALDARTQSLLGSDLELAAKSPFADDLRNTAEARAEASSLEVRFRTMLGVPKTEQTRLVQVQAIEGDFPFYGDITTTPTHAWKEASQGTTPSVVLEETLPSQLGIEIGETVSIAGENFVVGGVVHDAPGMFVPAYVIAPRVYTSLRWFKGAAALQRGALIDYYLHLKLPSASTEGVLSTLRPMLVRDRVESRTPAQRAEVLGNLFSNVGQFLALVAFISLLIGTSAAVAATHVFLLAQRATFATLRCVGATAADIRRLCLLQVILLGTSATALGTLLGLLSQQIFPLALGDSLYLSFHAGFHPEVLVAGVVVGVGSIVLYALPKVQELVSVTPLHAIRAEIERTAPRNSRWTLAIVIGLVVFMFAAITASSRALLFITLGGTLVCIALFVTLAAGLLWLVRRIPESLLPLSLRHGVKGLARPGNATVALLSVLGLVTCLTQTGLIAGHLLQRQMETSQNQDTPNLFLYDIQPDQIVEVRKALTDTGVRLLRENPIVLMRLALLRGQDVGTLLYSDNQTIPAWALTRDYWTSYRSDLVDNEQLVAGRFIGEVTRGTTPVPISLEDRLAERLGVKLGDSLTWDVQGRMVETSVTSLRDVQWERMERNAMVIFPAGVLEEDPQFRFFSARADSPEATTLLQSRLQDQLSNVALADLKLVLNSISDIVRGISNAVQLVTVTIALGALLSLLGVAFVAREVRRRELSLLKVIGVRSFQLRSIILAEFAVIAALAVVSGSFLALGLGYLLALEVFKAPFSAPLTHMLLANAGVICSILVVGLIASLGLQKQPPLAVLRAE